MNLENLAYKLENMESLQLTQVIRKISEFIYPDQDSRIVFQIKMAVFLGQAKAQQQDKRHADFLALAQVLQTYDLGIEIIK